MNVVYVLGDAEFGDICKIGFNSEWPKRYEQVRSHNPRDVIEWVSERSQAQGLVPYVLCQNKPGCVRLRDGQIVPIQAGGRWLKRVAGVRA